MTKQCNNFVCIHGHFYQPPRENPWTGEIEKQPSAEPFHDWNERITDECYRANAESKILDKHEKVREVQNNYSLMSFNFGPTLLSWLERHASDVYQSILNADKKSAERFSGHGSALAQTYNHMIMPLANRRDKKTQVYWGIRDFEYRFGRKPEGMWLSETAVDLETLESLAEQGIKFTILASHQAQRVKRKWSFIWHKVNQSNMDTQKPYVCRLPSGKQMVIFFYNGVVSSEVAFNGLLHNAEDLLSRLMNIFSMKERLPCLVHIATDGETYGHHHKFGDMALAYTLDQLAKNDSVRLTNYGEFLARFSPKFEVKILENTSWSCDHGVERWRSNCGCRMDHSHPARQEWRQFLREALDWLRDELATIFEKETDSYFKDPWKVRDEYIDIILNPNEILINKFFNNHSKKEITTEDIEKLNTFFEMQHCAMLMYTSCGWFFDDVARIETIQILRYAARAIELAQKACDVNLEESFLSRLELAISSDPKMKNGKVIYEKYVRPLSIHYEI